MIDLPPALPPANEQVIEQRLIACGLEPNGFSVVYEDYLQSIEVRIRAEAKVQASYFPCIWEASASEIVTFEQPEMREAYDGFVGELLRPEMLARSETSLSELGLLDGFPTRSDFASLSVYLEALERHAGFDAGSALQVDGDGILYNPPMASADYDSYVETYAPLMAVVLHASLIERLRLGFLGNEKYREEGQ